ncbi:MAG: hypothetical protein R2832_06795 [Rhodothermales bacterium]
MKILLGALLATLLNIILGWQWCVAAGAVVGWWSIKRGWLAGASAVGLSWLVLVSLNYAAAGEAVARMSRTMAAFVPNAPAWAVPVATVIVGSILGAAGGFFGQAAAPYISRPRS